MEKKQSERNKTILLTAEEKALFRQKLYIPQVDSTDSKVLSLNDITNKTILGDTVSVLPLLPEGFADVLFLDPPYNLTKNFNGYTFTQSDDASYMEYLRSWFPAALKTLKENGTVYLCGDWKNSACLYNILIENKVIVQNRITWQREKGRGAKHNWKNACEDIWFGTLSSDFYFDVESVKQKRKVIAPYRTDGKPKDWEETSEGGFRLTYPSNFWDDISVPYWSMAENTEHPTQKPEKLLAKLILASCPPDGLIFDPFLGSGTTSVAAKKLGRNYCGIEQNEEYACIAEKRLHLAESDRRIQGYSDGVFWERNTAAFQKK